MRDARRLTRRHFLELSAAAGLAVGLPLPAGAATSTMARRRIPGSDEDLPVIGLGTSDEFERLPDDGGTALKAVLTTLVDSGATLVDTAPMYGDAEQVVGRLLGELSLTEDLFLSSKVRTRGKADGLRSLQRSVSRLRKSPLDLLMVHSLVDAETQLDNLQQFKDAGNVRYIGITTSQAGDFRDMERLIRKRDLDFIQVNYSPLEPDAAKRVIPAAAERGVAVMINRAFANGRYFGLVRGHDLPAWAAEFDCTSWAQLALKYVLGHADVTAVLAATSDPRHMRDNVAAGSGRLPDAAACARIERLLRDL